MTWRGVLIFIGLSALAWAIVVAVATAALRYAGVMN